MKAEYFEVAIRFLKSNEELSPTNSMSLAEYLPRLRNIFLRHVAEQCVTDSQVTPAERQEWLQDFIAQGVTVDQIAMLVVDELEHGRIGPERAQLWVQDCIEKGADCQAVITAVHTKLWEEFGEEMLTSEELDGGDVIEAKYLQDLIRSLQAWGAEHGKTFSLPTHEL